MKSLRFLCLITLLPTLPAFATLRVEVAASTITQNEPLCLTIETDIPLGAIPDLGPLEHDFSIIQQGTNRSTHSFNGQTRQRTVLHLTLQPRRSGDLTIPALQIGGETSRPIQVRVTPILDGSSAIPSSQPEQPYSSYSPPVPMNWMGTPDVGGWGTSGNLVPGWGPLPGNQDWTTTPPAPTSPPPLAEPDTEGCGPWPWLTGIALIGWLLTALALWRQRGGRWPRMRSSTLTAATETPVTASIPSASLEELIAGVQRAYQSDDPFAARDALLRWAAWVWFEDAPTNLSRLAARCPSQLQRHILRLEQALYSPSPLPWNEEPIWELLYEISGNGPAKETSAS